MDLHRVRRLAITLVSSQLRSGRSSSNPRSFFGQPALIVAVDIALFLGLFGLVDAALAASSLSGSQARTIANALLPFLPMVAVGVVLVAGVMFELTTTAKFSASDAANWLPVTPSEYVAASAAAIAYTYSPAVALVLGALLPFVLYAGGAGVYVACVALTLVGLVEGALLVEMVRAVTQRASTVGAGRRGQVVLLVRAAILVVVILVLQLAFNPIFLFGLAERLSAVSLVTAIVPFFWSTYALTLLASGAAYLGVGFAVGEIAFVALLVYLAGSLRARFWVPTSGEVRLEAHHYAARNPVLAFFGLSEAESALVSKDLKGLFRRREMLPTLVVPIVLVILVLVEGTAFGSVGSVLWIGWVAGFFSLLIGGTSIGQERRAIQSLYAYPLSPENLVRAKAAFVLIPSVVVALLLMLIVGVFFGIAPSTLIGLIVLMIAVSVVLTFWGLAFAARFSDFQDRPRPQFLRPSGMLAATGSGVVLLFAILVPGTFALMVPSPLSVPLFALGLGLALGAGALSFGWTVSGFRELFSELPF